MAAAPVVRLAVGKLRQARLISLSEAVKFATISALTAGLPPNDQLELFFVNYNLSSRRPCGERRLACSHVSEDLPMTILSDEDHSRARWDGQTAKPRSNPSRRVSPSLTRPSKVSIASDFTRSMPHASAEHRDMPRLRLTRPPSQGPIVFCPP